MFFRNLNNNFSKINIMLCKNIIIRCSNWTFQSQSNSTYHCNQQQQTCQNLQIRMNTVQRNSLICNRRRRSSQMIPKRIKRKISKRTFRSFFKERKGRKRQKSHSSGRKRLPQRLKCRKSLTKKKNTCDWISPTLMCQNFCRWNVLKHDNKQKQNRQSSNINQQLKQNKIFKPLLYQKPRTMKKLQDQIKNRMHRIFRFCHLKNTQESTGCNLRKRSTHFLKKKSRKHQKIEFDGT